jgi:ribosomal protein S18 acetylase RimI-like enzyme
MQVSSSHTRTAAVIEIAPLTTADYPAVLRLWQSTEGITVRDVDSPDAAQRYLQRNPGLSFVARDGDQVIGAVLCGHDGRRGYLNHLAVAAGYRNRGIGSALVERCLAALQESGIGKCHLFVLDDNLPGQAFWKRTGWTPRNDLVMMSRTLSGSPNA